MRACGLFRGVVAVGLLSCFTWVVGCASPHRGPAEKLAMPKPKKSKGGDEVAGPVEPDTCKYNFEAKPASLPKKSRRDEARSFAQDADNAMAGIETAGHEEKRKMVLDALGILQDALRLDPYSPHATLEMAVAYAHVGKKKCAMALLERLAELEKIPDLTNDVGKVKTQAQRHPAFAGFRSEADAVLGE